MAATDEIGIQFKEAERARIKAEHHLTLLWTYPDYSVCWTEELGEAIDQFQRAVNIYQGIFDQLTEIPNARSS